MISVVSSDDIRRNRADLRAVQTSQLRALLEAVRRSNPFYRTKLSRWAVDASRLTLEQFSAECPFTTKQDLVDDQRVHPIYGSNLTYPLDHYVRCHQTSGTSGQHLRWLDTAENWNGMIETWKEVYRAAGINRSDRLFFAFSFGPFIGFWLAFEAAAQIGCLCIPGGGLSSAVRARAILDHGITVLCCTPTYALHLAEVAAAEKIDLSRAQVRRIIVAGEPGGSIPATRTRLERLWSGAAVFDHHGMTEVGPVTYECPVSPGRLHVHEAAFMAEIIDSATGQAVGQGQIGELVLTTLNRIGSPVLRYRTGDSVKAAVFPEGGICACGRIELALEGGILGRVDDMVVIRGVNVYPSAIEEIVRSCGGVAEYRVMVEQPRALPELRIEIEPFDAAPDPSALAAQLQKALLHSLGLRVPVSVVAQGSLPRFELKAKRWSRS